MNYTPSAPGIFYIDIGGVGDTQRGDYSILFDRTPSVQAVIHLTRDHDDSAPGVNQEVAGRAGDDRIDLSTNQGFGALGEQGDDFLLGSNDLNILSGGLGKTTLKVMVAMM